jgi:hypothetical protein
MTRAELDGRLGDPAARMKNKHDHLVPLSAALLILSRVCR